MKLTKYTHNPIAEIERAFDGFFNLTPVFHQLEEVYKTGDQVRFASDEERGMSKIQYIKKGEFYVSLIQRKVHPSFPCKRK